MDRPGRVRADRDRDAAARAAQAERGHRPRARARGPAATRRTPTLSIENSELATSDRVASRAARARHGNRCRGGPALPRRPARDADAGAERSGAEHDDHGLARRARRSARPARIARRRRRPRSPARPKRPPATQCRRAPRPANVDGRIRHAASRPNPRRPPSATTLRRLAGAPTRARPANPRARPRAKPPPAAAPAAARLKGRRPAGPGEPVGVAGGRRPTPDRSDLRGSSSCCSSLAAGRTVYLGVLHGAALRRAARSQQLTDEAVPAQRGTITDRNGVDLAVSEPAEDISATPYLLTRSAERGAAAGSAAGPVAGEVLRKLSERTRLRVSRAGAPRQAGAGGPRAEDPGGRRRAGRCAACTRAARSRRRCSASWAPKATGSPGSSIRATRCCTATPASGVSSATPSASRCRSPKSSREAPGTSLSLTLDANIQQRTEEVLGAVGRVFSPKDATAIVMDPSTGAILGDGQLAAGERQRPGRRPRRRAGEPRRRLRLRTGLDVQGGDRLRRPPAGAGHAVHAPSTCPTRSRSPTGRSTTTPNTPEETLTTAQILAQSSNVGAIKIGMLEGAEPVQRLGAPLRLRRADRRRAARRGNGRGAAARPLLGLLDGQPADRPGRARHADPDGRPRTRRSPTAASCAAPHIVRAVGGRSRAAAPGPSGDLSDDRRRASPDARGRAGPGRHRQRGLDPRLSARRQDRHRQQGRPGHRRVLPDARTSPRSSASRRHPTRSCCAR